MTLLPPRPVCTDRPSPPRLQSTARWTLPHTIHASASVPPVSPSHRTCSLPLPTGPFLTSRTFLNIACHSCSGTEQSDGLQGFDRSYSFDMCTFSRARNVSWKPLASLVRNSQSKRKRKTQKERERERARAKVRERKGEKKREAREE